MVGLLSKNDKVSGAAHYDSHLPTKAWLLNTCKAYKCPGNKVDLLKDNNSGIPRASAQCT